jgi:hypothetical protein
MVVVAIALIVAAVEEEAVVVADFTRVEATFRALLRPSRGSERRMARVVEMETPRLAAAVVEEEEKLQNKEQPLGSKKSKALDKSWSWLRLVY